MKRGEGLADDNHTVEGDHENIMNAESAQN